PRPGRSHPELDADPTRVEASGSRPERRDGGNADPTTHQDAPSQPSGPTRWVAGVGWVVESAEHIPPEARWVPGVGYVVEEGRRSPAELSTCWPASPRATLRNRSMPATAASVRFPENTSNACWAPGYSTYTTGCSDTARSMSTMDRAWATGTRLSLV